MVNLKRSLNRLLLLAAAAVVLTPRPVRSEPGAEATQRARRLAARRYAGMAVALPDSAFAGGLRVCVREPPSGIVGYWSVPAKAIGAMDSELKAHLRKSGIDKALPFSFSLYVRQYAGIVRDGKRYVYVNALLLEKGSPLLTQAKRTFPGSCAGISGSWGIQYDVAAKRFTGFSKS
jgi:hypothetical protein